MANRVPYSQRYLFNAIPDTNHNANPTNHNSKGNPKPTNPTNPNTAVIHFRTLVTLRRVRVRVRVELELRLGLVRVRIGVWVRLGLDLGLGLC